jgi:AraC-like DNA-binding protein
MQTFVRSATLNGYVGLAHDLGLDAAGLMRDVGLNVDDLAIPEQWISAPAVARLLVASSEVSGREDFALRLAELRRLSTLGPLSLVLREEPDLRSVVALLMRFEHSYNEALRMRLVDNEGVASLQMWFEFGEPAPAEQALTLGVAALHGIIKQCLGGNWRPLSVCFSHRAPADLETHHRMFGPALRFDHEFTGLVFYEADLESKNALADPLMRPYAQQILDTVVSPRAMTWAGRVRNRVEFLLPLGKCSIDQVARSFGLDRRTLQRNLARDGESYSSILHSTRASLSERYLSNDRYSVSEVAHLVGFAAPSAFCRWFTQQFGVSPSVWRTTSAAARVSEQAPGSRPVPHQRREAVRPANA